VAEASSPPRRCAIEFGVTILPDPPCSRFVELVRLAEECGFDWAYTYDSHILWQEGCVLVTAAAVQTERIGLGFCVTNPGTRDPTVTASFHATLNTIIPGRVVIMIGRGDSARRTIGLHPVKIAEFEAATALIRDMSNGRPVIWNDRDIVLKWARDLPEIPVWVAGYGPKALGVAGRQGDGVVIQLADPDIIDWIMGQAGAAAQAGGRAPDALAPIVCAPVALDEDMAAARDAVRWFPAMVGNHVADLLTRYDQSMLPESLTSYLHRREFYDYEHHSRQGAKHGEFVDDETCDRFCILGPLEDHIQKLRTLEAHGVKQFNIYLMTGGQEETLRAYGEHIIPLFKREA
jgi:probable F420-dependent oxidoreductase